MKSNRLLILLFIISGFVFNSYSQDGKIVGKIYDGQSGGILPDAVVKLDGTGKGAASDLEGAYSLEGVKPGEYTIKASYVGYVAQSVSVKVKPGEVVNVDVILKPEGTTTDTVTIEAERKDNNEASL